jgi:hypothetical protein
MDDCANSEKHRKYHSRSEDVTKVSISKISAPRRPPCPLSYIPLFSSYNRRSASRVLTMMAVSDCRSALVVDVRFENGCNLILRRRRLQIARSVFSDVCHMGVRTREQCRSVLEEIAQTPTLLGDTTTTITNNDPTTRNPTPSHLHLESQPYCL